MAAGSSLNPVASPAIAPATAKSSPSDAIPQIWYNRGKMLVEQQRYNAAVASFDMALKFQPNDPKSLIFRGIALFHLHYYQSALGDFRTAAEMAPDNREAWIFQGAVLKALKHPGAAIECYRTALLLQQPEGMACEEYPMWI